MEGTKLNDETIPSVKIESEFLSLICFNEFSVLFLHFDPWYRPALPSIEQSEKLPYMPKIYKY